MWSSWFAFPRNQALFCSPVVEDGDLMYLGSDRITVVRSQRDSLPSPHTNFAEKICTESSCTRPRELVPCSRRNQMKECNTMGASSTATMKASALNSRKTFKGAGAFSGMSSALIAQLSTLKRRCCHRASCGGTGSDAWIRNAPSTWKGGACVDVCPHGLWRG